MVEVKQNNSSMKHIGQDTEYNKNQRKNNLPAM